MASEENKIPSPQEIMGESKKFTPQEIEKLKQLQDKINQMILQFGQLTLSKIKLEEQENLLKAHLADLEKEETNLAKTLSDKYGKGNLNIETGEFIPTK